ncbi:carboxypeptidase N subunit 2 [Drosophila madeirensis]|uniref:Carboxypeptidase N subunit 2 n=2 Tax=Drosophila madeirensis TaxID=30013 RepID=A0AAU9FNL1_DROMD
MRGRGGIASTTTTGSSTAAPLQQLQVPSPVDHAAAASSFAQLSHIHYMTNNQTQIPSPGQTQMHHSQQDMRLLANGGGKTLNAASLPRHRMQESTLSHYSQPLALANGIRLTQDHFNHNHSHPHGHNGGVYAKPCDAMAEPGYIHNNSHYSLPLDHDLPPSPTPTPPPPALPLRNGVGMALIHGNTTGRRSFNSNNNNNVATLSNNNHGVGGGVILASGSNNNGSLRRYH